MHLFKHRALMALTLLLALGWGSRELARAFDGPKAVSSGTISVDEVRMEPFSDNGAPVGKNGLYLLGDTPASTRFATGRFVLDAGKSPHPPHTHTEEEVMIIESGHGEILCDGVTKKVGPGSVMYTTPNTPHGITNTGSEPIVFYYVKWESKK